MPNVWFNLVLYQIFALHYKAQTNQNKLKNVRVIAACWYEMVSCSSFCYFDTKPARISSVRFADVNVRLVSAWSVTWGPTTSPVKSRSLFFVDSLSFYNATADYDSSYGYDRVRLARCSSGERAGPPLWALRFHSRPSGSLRPSAEDKTAKEILATAFTRRGFVAWNRYISRTNGQWT